MKIVKMGGVKYHYPKYMKISNFRIYVMQRDGNKKTDFGPLFVGNRNCQANQRAKELSQHR